MAESSTLITVNPKLHFWNIAWSSRIWLGNKGSSDRGAESNDIMGNSGGPESSSIGSMWYSAYKRLLQSEKKGGLVPKEKKNLEDTMCRHDKAFKKLAKCDFFAFSLIHLSYFFHSTFFERLWP